MWDIIKDNMSLFLGILFLGIPLLVTLWYERKNAKEKKKKQKLFIVFVAVIIGCIFLTLLGIDKINRENRDKETAKSEKINSDAKVDALTAEIKELKKINTENVDFQKALKDKFQIVKDSNNQPKKIIYTTNIDKARDVYIGGDHK